MMQGIKYGVDDPFSSLEEPPSRGSQARAMLGGKYNYLIKAIEPAEKREKDLEELGWRERGDFLGEEDLPQGYYVWVEPYLMIYATSTEDPLKISSDATWVDFTEDQHVQATCNYKYRGLLHTIFAPGEIKVHGTFLEFGYRERESYLGQEDIPPGNWVWVFPHWFIFEEDASQEETDSMDLVEAFEPELLEKATAQGRFEELIEAFYLPYAFEELEDFFIMGKKEAQEVNELFLPGGYWVWLKPYLYVFERDGKIPDEKI